MVAGVSPQPSNYPLVNRLLAVDPLNVRGAEFTTLLAALDQIGAGLSVLDVKEGLERLVTPGPSGQAAQPVQSGCFCHPR